MVEDNYIDAVIEMPVGIVAGPLAKTALCFGLIEKA